jgi:hypothetical protein
VEKVCPMFGQCGISDFQVVRFSSVCGCERRFDPQISFDFRVVYAL